MLRNVLSGPGHDRPLVDMEGNGVERAGLVAALDQARATLRAHGVGRKDRVVLVGRDGPEMALAFLAIAGAAACAPLPPTLPTAGLVDAVTTLGGKMVITVDPLEPDAIEQLTCRGIPVGLARLFSERSLVFEGPVDGEPPSADGPTEPADVALVLRTSGTTGAPKTVPLTGADIIGSARTIAGHLQLDTDDVGLIVMPLFHIHGLVAGLLAPLVSGGGVVCSPGFSAVEMSRWITARNPSWYTAVPTMHQAIAMRHRANPHELGQHRLRFVRSSSSSMAPALLNDVETMLGVPLIEAYGMTEAAHQMTSNPLPPAVRKAGSVGVSAGVDVRIVDPDDRVVDRGVDGDVLIAGPNVFSGYSDPPGANDDAFVDRWFRTGDVGHVDDDGYLYLTGRRKEMINRGGESIAPREIEDALLAHPDVAEAMAFGVPDSRLGEQIAALVVPHDGARIDERTIRADMAERLDRPRVPRRVLVVDETPKGPTGKPQRVGLAERLGLADLDREVESCEPDRPPESDVELFIAELWADVLETEIHSIRKRWLDIGGDSLLAMRLLGRINDKLGLDVSVIDFFDRPTVAAQTELVERLLLDADER